MKRGITILTTLALTFAISSPVMARPVSPRAATNLDNDYLNKHPRVATRLENHPGLVDNRGFVDNHPGFHHFLQDHPRARREFKSHPRVFMHSAETH